MTRWIVFDDDTADAVVSRFKRGAAEIESGDAVSSAIDLGRSCLIVLPASTSGRVLLAQVQPKNEAAAEDAPVDYEPTGFLGLTDHPVFTRPKPAQPVSMPEKQDARKSWWRLRRSA